MTELAWYTRSAIMHGLDLLQHLNVFSTDRELALLYAHAFIQSTQQVDHIHYRDVQLHDVHVGQVVRIAIEQMPHAFLWYLKTTEALYQIAKTQTEELSPWQLSLQLCTPLAVSWPVSQSLVMLLVSPPGRGIVREVAAMRYGNVQQEALRGTLRAIAV